MRADLLFARLVSPPDSRTLEIGPFKYPARVHPLVDLRDFQLLVEVHRHPFASNEGIGREIGISGPAVRDRLVRLKERGILTGLTIMPLPQSLHRYSHIFVYTGVNEKLDPNELLRLPNVMSIRTGAAGELWVVTLDPIEKAEPPDGLDKLMGRPPARVGSFDPPEGPGRADTELSALDWRVIEGLMVSPRATLKEQSAFTHLSPRTVRRVRDRLIARDLVAVIPIIDTRNEPGLLVYGGHLAVDRISRLDGLHVPGLTVYRRLYHPPGGWFLGHASTYSELKAVETELRSSPGVTALDMGPIQFPRFNDNRLRAWVREEIRRREAWRRTKPIPPQRRRSRP